MFRSCSSTYESEYSSYCGYSSRYSSYCDSSNNASKWSAPKEGYTFGHFKDTHDWVECNSKKEPGKVYFFNVRSKCATWVRPVADDVPLQHFSHQARLCDSDCDLNDPSMVISDSEQEVDNCSVGTRALPFDMLRGLDIVKSTDRDVLRKLYYGTPMPAESDEYTDEDFYTGLEVSNAEGVFDTSEKVAAKCVAPTRANTVPDETADNSWEYCIEISDFLEIELGDSTQPLKIKSLKQGNSNNTSSSESEEEFESNHYVPRLQRIHTTDLITRKPTKRRKPAKPRETKKKKIVKPQPTIYNMYGTKTINYNSDYECQLDKPIPRQFKVTNLSDSSVSTTSWPNYNKRAEEDLNKFLRRYRVRRPEMPKINLSESSSSSSCSSDCSCSSSDSDSSSSTSSGSSSDLNSES